MMPDPEGPGRRKAALLRGPALPADGREPARAEAAFRPARVPRWPEAARERCAGAEAAFGALGARAGRRLAGAAARQAGRPDRASPRGQSSASTAGQSRSRLVVADEHLPALLLAAAPAIAADLARTRLAPLDGLAEGRANGS